MINWSTLKLKFYVNQKKLFKGLKSMPQTERRYLLSISNHERTRYTHHIDRILTNQWEKGRQEKAGEKTDGYGGSHLLSLVFYCTGAHWWWFLNLQLLLVTSLPCSGTFFLDPSSQPVFLAPWGPLEAPLAPSSFLLLPLSPSPLQVILWYIFLLCFLISKITALRVPSKTLSPLKCSCLATEL